MAKATAAKTTRPGVTGGAESTSAAEAPKPAKSAKAKSAKTTSTTKVTKVTTKVRTAAAKVKPKPKAKSKLKKPKPPTTTAATVQPASSGGSTTSGDADADEFFREQRQALLVEREAYSLSASSLRAEAEQLAQDREPGDVQFDEESGEGDSMNVERERDLVLSAQAMASIEEIDRALAKIDLGTYGICDRCGQAIPRERMKALPHAALCVRCKSGGLSRR